MYIWPFGRPAQFSVATAVPAQPPAYQASYPASHQVSHQASYDSKMEKEKGYLPRPVPGPHSTSNRSRICRPSRRFVAITMIAMIMLWNLQPVVRLLQKPLPSLHDAACLPGSTARACLLSESVGDTQVSSLPGKSSQHAYTKEKALVPLEAHIMSQCPDAQDCLVDFIVPAMQRISDKVNFTLSFIGDIDEDETVHCKHGEDECLGNIVMLCAEKLYPDPKISLGFNTCLIRDYKNIATRHLVQGCALEHAVDFDKLNKCMSEEGEGLELLKASIRRSADKGAEYSCTVRLNDKLRCIRDGGEWVDCEDGSEPGDLVRDVEALYN